MTCEFVEMLRKKMFKFINIILDIIFGIYHFFSKDEPTHLRITSFIKFNVTALFNFFDAFEIRCKCPKKRKFSKSEVIREAKKILEQKKFEALILKELADEEKKGAEGNAEMKMIFVNIKDREEEIGNYYQKIK